MKLFAVFPICAVFAAASVQAAEISWNVFNITGNPSEVLTAGKVVVAHAGADLGNRDVIDGATMVINGVTFDDGYTIDNPTHYDTITHRAGLPNSGDTKDYFTLLQYGDRSTNNEDQTITLNGLVAGSTYAIQIWFSDKGQHKPNPSMLVINNGYGTPNPDTAGHVAVRAETAETGAGQYAIGTFVAERDSQLLGVRKWTIEKGVFRGVANTCINGYQLRDLGPNPDFSLLDLEGRSKAKKLVIATAVAKVPDNVAKPVSPVNPMESEDNSKFLPTGETVLISEDFERASHAWEFEGNASRYEHEGKSDNYARTGTGAAMLIDAKGSGSLTLTEPIKLKTLGVRELFITFDYLWYDFGSAQCKFSVEYSPDKGKTWKKLDKDYTSEKQRGSSFVSLSSGFTDEALIRFYREQDGKRYHDAYIDNIAVIAKR